MTRETGMATKVDLKRIYKKQGIKKDTFLNYRPKTRGERISLEVGVVSAINKLLKKWGLAMILQGCDRDNNYLFRIIKDDDSRPRATIGKVPARPGRKTR